MSTVDVKKLQRHLGATWIEDTLRHQATRTRFELARRSAKVASVRAITPRMLRIALHSPELAEFRSESPDDHVKLFFPDGSSRHFTPRAFDTAAATVTIDFALHGSGPAMEWARNARIGDELVIGGPRGSHVIADDFDWYVLIGDESALPAIGRRVEQLRAGVPVTTIVAIADRAERQQLVTRAAWQPIWIERGEPDAGDAAAILAAVGELPAGDGYVWIAGEAELARSLRTHFRATHPAEWLKVAGYWQRGVSDAHIDI